MLTNNQILFLFFSNFFLVGLLTPVMRKIALQLDYIDRPNSKHKTHIQAVPYLGGIAIILGILGITYTFIIFQENMRVHIWTITVFFVPSLILGIVGLIDDRKSLDPLPRFIAQTLAGIFVATVNIATDSVGNPTGVTALDVAITVVWIIGITNAINFFDNLDGGAAGALAATTFGIFLISQSNGQIIIAATAMTIFSAMLGFLIWNNSPARIYMGDAGALFLGTLVATLTIRLDPDVDYKYTSLAIPVILLALPILDTSIAVCSRIRRRKSIFEGGKDHLSHRLMRNGYNKKQTALLLWSLSAIFSGLATTIARVNSGSDLLLLLSATFWLLLFVIFFFSADE